MKKLLIISGASASGKDTIMNHFKTKNKINKLVGYTNRKQRVNEVDGEDYLFAENHSWLPQNPKMWEEELIENDDLLITREGVGNGGNDRYAFSLKDLQDGLNYIILDVEGQEKFSKLVESRNIEDVKLVKIFITTQNPDINLQRMQERGSETQVDFQARVEHAKKQNEPFYIQQYDKIIVNDDYKESSKEIETFLKKQFQPKIKK